MNKFDFDPYGGIDDESYEEYKRSLQKIIDNALASSKGPPMTKEEAFKKLDEIDISFIEQYLRKKKLDNIK